MSLPFAIRQILDRIGSQDSYFPTETPDLSLPSPQTPESIALEESLRRLVARFQELEQKTTRSERFDAATQPVTNQLQNVKEDGEVDKHICLSCGHWLDGVPLTPEETLPVDPSGSFSKSSLFGTKSPLIRRFSAEWV